VKCRNWLASSAIALVVVPAFAAADAPSLAEWTRTRVDEGIVKPLAEREVSRFSRARPVAGERRIRVLRETAANDKSGQPFVPFAIDVRFADGDWHGDDIVGCAYVGKGDLYVKRGDGYRPVAFLFGKNADVVAGACEAAPGS
jgi:hypothetical protein